MKESIVNERTILQCKDTTGNKNINTLKDKSSLLLSILQLGQEFLYTFGIIFVIFRRYKLWDITICFIFEKKN